MGFVRWSDVRDKHVATIGADKVEEGKARLLARLAEERKRHGEEQADSGR